MQRSAVAVAQLVESRIVIPVVVGSSPISHPKRIKHLAQLTRLGFVVSGEPVGRLRLAAAAVTRGWQCVDTRTPTR